MEYIDRIFYRKINPSDFKKLYSLEIPPTGGGQTYIEAAGISEEEIVDFLEYAEKKDSEIANDNRFIYTFNAYTLGKIGQEDWLEFAPRSNRKNYKISRQGISDKHPAWRVDNGFPEPNKDINGDYISDNEFAGIIDDLVILILRTTYHRYYASYINQRVLPADWPQNIGLEKIFTGDRRGVLNLSQIDVEFVNSFDNPFGGLDVLPRLKTGKNVLLYGVPGSGKSWTIEHEYCPTNSEVRRVIFHPDYTNADFIGQIMPVIEDKQVSYEFTPGPFTSFMREAFLHPQKEYILIIEEINRGNAPAIFGDVFQLLDRKRVKDSSGLPIGTSEYYINNRDMAKIIYNDPDHRVRIPSNFSILGTMNTSDQNVFTLDTAFQRRWEMRLIENSFESVSPDLATTPILDTSITWEKFCTTINEIILNSKTKMASAEDKRLGVYFIQENDLIYEPIANSNTSNQDLLTEYNNLLRLEADPNKKITGTKKARLEEIREALKQNRIFPEKVLKYLWDDAFKFNPNELFDTASYNSLEKIIQHFLFSYKDDRFAVFNQNVRTRLGL